MITVAQIDAESPTPALTDSQVLGLAMLVKRFPSYRDAVGLYPDFDGKIALEVATPTVKTQALKAVLTQLGIVPSFVVESSGSAEAQSFFSTRENWAELAQDVLDVLFPATISRTYQNYAIAQRRVTSQALRERGIVTQRDTGRRF